MKKLFSSRIVWIVAVLAVVVTVFTFSTRKQTVSFSADVKPILNKKCISCHGGVKKQGGFSLLFREEALGKTESGQPAIIPGDPDKSEMIKRLTVHDPEERMPYKEAPLSDEEIDILRRWVKQGAQWGEHWAYVPVKPVTVPKASTFFGLISNNNDWAKNEIDHFIAEKQEELELTHAEEADKKTLFRRVSLDLIGMPAKDEWLQQYLADKTGKGYEALVDSLLSSPHYGERWTSMWLDLARYADTKGYEADQARNIWKYRDWLIKAFNSDKPYNEFLIEQLAGDLLPDPTDAQYIATAFHRNSMTNDEGGTDNEEFRTAAVMDRVNTTWEVLMGTTFSCVQCHSHPYDPFTHDEYYKFLAYFNNSRDEDTQADYPLLRQFKGTDSSKLPELKNWLNHHASKEKADGLYSFLRTWQPAINSLQCDHYINGAQVSSWFAGLRNNGSCRLPDVHLDQKTRLLYRYTSGFDGGVWTIRLDSLTGAVLKKTVLKKTNGWEIAQIDLPVNKGVHDLYFTYSNPQLNGKENTGVLFDWFHFDEAFPGKGEPGYDSAYSAYWQLLRAPAETTPVMVESNSEQHRATHIFERGNWLVKGEEVEPGTPHILNPIPANAPNNRMGLAMWLTDKKNPLTARTMVNRLWEQLFGNGIAETLEDMGTQGISPTHRELLDWLAWTFMNEDGWSIKKTIKRMVLSATYRQASYADKDILEKDPFNRYLTRGPRVRLSAEQVRDQALVISGIMSPKMYGPSVMPYQPKGIWLSPWNGADWKQSDGEDQYRRGVYIYWKRTAPYPSMMTFDATGREVCSSRRIRTNTPLQALVTLNDEAYLEAARHFAVRMQKEGGAKVSDRIRLGYELATYQTISNEGLAVLEKLYETSLDTYKKDTAAACDMLENITADQRTAPEIAAMTVVASSILNMDELITKN
ncbi:MAG: DUF1553 domain-containing protein [Chitinophagaceae bacterium]|nr:DUF1553 domain-containing protein [Chitinophagaceae bacterium]